MGTATRTGRATPKSWLEARIGSLPPDKVAALDEALRFALSLT